jgi:hypothetical protein
VRLPFLVAGASIAPGRAFVKDRVQLMLVGIEEDAWLRLLEHRFLQEVLPAARKLLPRNDTSPPSAAGPPVPATTTCSPRARDRRKRETGKCGGRKSYAERSKDMVALAKKLARYPINGRTRSLREIELASKGFVASSGLPFGAAAVKRMVEG